MFLENAAPAKGGAARGTGELAQLAVNAHLMLLHVIALLEARVAGGTLERAAALVHGAYVLVEVEALGESGRALRTRKSALASATRWAPCTTSGATRALLGAHTGEHVERARTRGLGCVGLRRTS